MKFNISRKLPLAVLGLGAMLVAVQPMMAQPPQDGDKTTKRERRGQRGQRGDRMQKMAEQLNLTEEQKTQLKPIFEESRTQSKSIRQNAQLTPEQKREQMMAIRKDTMQKVNAILTVEQREKMKELRKQGRGERGQRRKDKAANQA